MDPYEFSMLFLFWNFDGGEEFTKGSRVNAHHVFSVGKLQTFRGKLGGELFPPQSFLGGGKGRLGLWAVIVRFSNLGEYDFTRLSANAILRPTAGVLHFSSLPLKGFSQFQLSHNHHHDPSCCSLIATSPPW